MHSNGKLADILYEYMLSRVICIFTVYVADFRAWLPDYEDDMVAGLSRKISILSNLNKDTAEDFQVCVYYATLRITWCV